MGAQHRHKQLLFISWSLKIVHRSCEYVERCKTFVPMFVLYISMIWFAFCSVWIVSTILGGLMRPKKKPACKSSCNVCYISCEAKQIRSESVVKCSCANCERSLSCATTMKNYDEQQLMCERRTDHTSMAVSCTCRIPETFYLPTWAVSSSKRTLNGEHNTFER